MMMYQSQFIEMFGDCSNPKYPVYYLGDVCSVQRGGSPRPISEYITEDSDGLNWIKIGDADDSIFITKTAEKIKPSGLKKTRQVYAGDLLLSNSMSFGRPYILKIDGCIHDGWLVLHFDQGKIDPIYLCCYLSQKRTYLEMAKLAAGGVVNNLNSEVVKKVPAIIPPISIQKQYVSIVEQADKSKFGNGFKSQFIEMFGDISDNVKGFPVKKLSECCSYISDGSHFSPQEAQNGKYPMLSVKDMTPNGFSYESCKYIDEKDYNSLLSNGCKPLKDDVLVAKDGSYFKYAFALNEEIDQAILSSIAILRPNTEIVCPMYLAYYMLIDEVVRLVEKNYLTGTAIRRVILKGFKEIPTILPPIDQQRLFITILEQADKSKSVCRQAIKRLAS